jgi:hypothetical protein
MSEEKVVALIPYADFTIKDLETIEKFKEDGMLGLHTLVDTDVERCMALYIDGKTYRQVAHIAKVRKEVVLFLAHKFSWWELRKEYLDELQATMKDKILDSKLQTQEFLFNLIMAYRKKIGKNLNKYLKTDDEQWMDKLDNKDMGVIFKCVELLEKLNQDTFNASNPEKSLVAFNGMGEGVTITKTGTNSVEITPKSPFASKLKQFADLKREEERKSQAPQKAPHDIDVEKPLTEKESE